MINKLNFNIPIDFSNNVPVRGRLLGKITDSYFSFGTTKAVLLKNDAGTINVQLNNFGISRGQKNCLNFIKVISWITVITPILMLIGKIIFRALNNFNLINQPTSNQEIIQIAREQIEAFTPEKKREIKESNPGNCFEFYDQFGKKWILVKGMIMGSDAYEIRSLIGNEYILVPDFEGYFK